MKRRITPHKTLACILIKAQIIMVSDRESVNRKCLDPFRDFSQIRAMAQNSFSDVFVTINILNIKDMRFFQLTSIEPKKLIPSATPCNRTTVKRRKI